MSADGTTRDEPARRGRPRKWASEAERKRAYRARRAEDLAEPERLRTELREARAEVALLRARAASLQRQVERAGRDAAKRLIVREELEAELERRDNTVAFWQRRAEVAEERLRGHRQVRRAE